MTIFMTGPRWINDDCCDHENFQYFEKILMGMAVIMVMMIMMLMTMMGSIGERVSGK